MTPMRKLWTCIVVMFVLMGLCFWLDLWILAIPAALLWSYGFWIGMTQLNNNDYDDWFVVDEDIQPQGSWGSAEPRESNRDSWDVTQ